MAVHKKQRLTYNHPDSASEGNVRQRKAKSTVNVASLFDRANKANKQNLAPRSRMDAPTIATMNNQNCLSSMQSKSKACHPAFLQFADAAETYRDALRVAKAQDLDSVHDSLVAHVDGVAVEGKPLDTPGAVNYDDIKARAEEAQALCALIDEEYVSVDKHCEDSSIGTRSIKIGDILLTFAQQLGTKEIMVNQMVEELRRIESEIIAACKDVADAEEHQVKMADKALRLELNTLLEEINAAKKENVEDIKKARKEAQAATAEMDRKLEQFMREL